MTNLNTRRNTMKTKKNLINAELLVTTSSTNIPFNCSYLFLRYIMLQKITFLLIVALLLTTVSCATIPEDRYNTQKGAAIGAGIGALLGQAIGHNTESTLVGAGIGTLVGSIAGNATDQSYEAVREAARTNKRVVYIDGNQTAVEAIPGLYNQQTNCRKVTKRTWDKGTLVNETVEEICEGEKSSRDY